MTTSEADLAVFRSLGLNDSVVAPLAKNPKLSAKLMEVVKGAGVAATGCDPVKGNLLYHVAAKMKDSLGSHRAFLGRHIGAGNLRLNSQVGGCVGYTNQRAFGMAGCAPPWAVCLCVCAGEEGVGGWRAWACVLPSVSLPVCALSCLAALRLPCRARTRTPRHPIATARMRGTSLTTAACLWRAPPPPPLVSWTRRSTSYLT
jgi:hypothetical protein